MTYVITERKGKTIAYGYHWSGSCREVSKMEMEDKKELLCRLSRALGGRSSGFLWGFGVSVLLYAYGQVDDFDEIDIVVSREGVRFAATALASLGPVAQQALPLLGCGADFYRSYRIDGVLVHLMSGLRVRTGRREYAYRFDHRSIPHILKIGNEELPCTTLEEWKYLYELTQGHESELMSINSLFEETGMIFKELYHRMQGGRYL